MPGFEIELLEFVQDHVSMSAHCPVLADHPRMSILKPKP